MDPFHPVAIIAEKFEVACQVLRNVHSELSLGAAATFRLGHKEASLGREVIPRISIKKMTRISLCSHKDVLCSVYAQVLYLTLTQQDIIVNKIHKVSCDLLRVFALYRSYSECLPGDIMFGSSGGVLAWQEAPEI